MTTTTPEFHENTETVARLLFRTAQALDNRITDGGDRSLAERHDAAFAMACEVHESLFA